jgi:hypothetical protein
LLLVCDYVRTHLFTTAGSNSLALVDPFCCRLASADKFIPGISEVFFIAFGGLYQWPLEEV